MEWIAHSENNNGKTQSLADHLLQVASRAGEFASVFNILHASELAMLVGIYHDLGKYDEQVQQRIRGLLKKRVPHSGAGARFLFEQFSQNPTLAYILSLLVLSHHTGLVEWTHWRNRVREASSGVANRIELESPVSQNRIRNMQSLQIDTSTHESTLAVSVLIRMLFSSLVDADFLDTEGHFQEDKSKRRGNLKLTSVVENADFGNYVPLSKVDEIRSEMHEFVMSQAGGPVGLYDLCLPTGGGKTRTALRFAIEHAQVNGLERVIVAIPFTTIIEQTVEEYRKWLGHDAVLEHHHLAEYKESGDEEDSDFGVNHKLASENWDMPFVVTTHVQFFESLFGRKTSVCRKLHNIANSVVIIDEAQMIPVEYLPVIAPLLRTLTDQYRTSFVVCTATQPALDYYGVNMRHLIPEPERYQAELLRTVIEPRFLGHKDSVESLFADVSQHQQALVICNKKSTVEKLYLEARKCNVEALVLTTNLYPAHRMRIIREIRDRLNSRESCIVLATQLVEAGVDISFPVVYREIAPLDRLIQAAGRANRHGEMLPALGKCVVIELDGVAPLQNESLATGITKSMFNKHEEGIRIQSPEVCSVYYEKLYRIQSEQYNSHEKTVWRALTEWDHPCVDRLMRFIKDDSDVPVIPLEALQNEERSVVQALLDDIQQAGYVTKEQRRTLGRYLVQVRDVTKTRIVVEGANIRIWTGPYHSTLGAI